MVRLALAAGYPECTFIKSIVLLIVGYIPEKGYLEKLLASYPNFNDPDYSVTDADKDRMICVDGATTQKLEPLPLQ